MLDEPSTGLDPGARIDLWQTLYRLRDQQDVTVLLTTHLMEEAERCDRVAIIDHGRIVASNTPEALRAEIGGDVISARTKDATSLGQRIATTLAVEVSVLNDEVRIEHPDGPGFITRVDGGVPGRDRFRHPGQADARGRLHRQDRPAPERGERVGVTTGRVQSPTSRFRNLRRAPPPTVSRLSVGSVSACKGTVVATLQ